MASRAIISLADVVRSCADLQPADADAVRALREALGLEVFDAVAVAAPAVGVWAATAATTLTAEPAAGERKWEPPAESPPESPVPDARAKARVATITRLARRTVPEPDWAAQAFTPVVPPTHMAAAQPPPPPLFGSVKHRAILTAALATVVAEGDLDVRRIVATLASGRPLRRLPRRLAPTLRRGAQLLLDRSPAMDPFRQDEHGLVEQLRDVVGRGKLEVLHFVGCPGPAPARLAGSGPRHTWSAWRPPPADTPILIVSDFGIGGPLFSAERATTSEWRDFVAAIRAAGAVPIGLVPYEARRWPASLVRQLTLLHWSERTTARVVRRARREHQRRVPDVHER